MTVDDISIRAEMSLGLLTGIGSKVKIFFRICYVLMV